MRCGAEPLTAIPDTTNKRGVLINNHYDIVLRELLGDTPWNFATARISYFQLGAPLFGFKYSYSTSQDVLRVLEVENVDDYRIEGGKIVTNTSTETLNVKIILFSDDPTKYSPSFNTALYLKLAENIAYSLVQSQSLQQSIIAEADRYLRRARSYNSQEGVSESRYNEQYTTGIRL